jgi:metal-responsive CopG/Arc/MetJ family transcriptional regulator
MKTLRTSDDVHQRLTGLLGELTAQTMRMQTYTDAIESLLSQSVALPPELLAQIEDFAIENRRLGYTSREEFVRDVVRWRLRCLHEEYECVEVAREEYEMLQQATMEAGMPCASPSDFVRQQIRNLLEEYAEARREKEEREKRTVKK